MDVVYPLGKGSKFRDDFELRYSLRSLDVQPWVDGVFIIGHRPAWVRGVKYISCNDPYKAKDANIINKILRACGEVDTRFFVVNSDDQIFLRVVNHKDMVPMLENNKKIDYEIKQKSRSNNWHRRVKETVNYAKSIGKPAWIFQSHVPYIVDSEQYPRVMSQVAWGQGNGFTTHIYFNLTMESPEVEPMRRTARVRHPINKHMAQKAVERSTFLYFNNSGLGEGLKSYLQDRFPNPSRWEK